MLTATAMAQSNSFRYQKVAPDVTLRQLSPVEYFRVLLGMKAAERARVLSSQSPEQKQAILAKLKEYEALPKEIREARLHQTQLRWDLLDLMKLPPAERANRLKEVAAEDRPRIEERLRQWDQVPLASQKIFLEKEGFIGKYLSLQGNDSANQKDILGETELKKWQALPLAQRQEMCDRFRQFFELNGREQQRTLNVLSDSERQEMDAALKSFAKLPPAQRKQCIASFSKFATMAPEERVQFLQNAARWERMTPHEREVWRKLVQELPPALPGQDGDSPPMPPGMKAVGQSEKATGAFATNAAK